MEKKPVASSFAATSNQHHCARAQAFWKTKNYIYIYYIYISALLLTIAAVAETREQKQHGSER